MGKTKNSSEVTHTWMKTIHNFGRTRSFCRSFDILKAFDRVYGTRAYDLILFIDSFLTDQLTHSWFWMDHFQFHFEKVFHRRAYIEINYTNPIHKAKQNVVKFNIKNILACYFSSLT